MNHLALLDPPDPRNLVYKQKGNIEHIRLAFLDSVATDVPAGLSDWHQFRPFDSDRQMEQLVRWIAPLLGREVVLPTVQWPAPIPFEPNCADRDVEWPLIRDMLSGRSRTRILLVQGESGLGKTELLRQTGAYAQKLGVPVARVNFKGGGTSVEMILGQLHLDLEAELPSFVREGACKTHLLRKDFRALREPVLLIFDHFEDATNNQNVTNWLNQQLLPEVETSLGLTVIVSGQSLPPSASASWSDLARVVKLPVIDQLEQWEPWVNRNFPHFRTWGADLKTILMLANGKPSVVADSCRAIAQWENRA